MMEWGGALGVARLENGLFTMRPYDGLMVQPWRISRFNGQLSMVEASLERAGATLACAFQSQGKCAAGVVRTRRVALCDTWFIAQMRIILCATAISALAVVILMLL
jgi:hypothetical protein